MIALTAITLSVVIGYAVLVAAFYQPRRHPRGFGGRS